MITILLSKSTLGLTIVEYDLGPEDNFIFSDVFIDQNLENEDINYKFEEDGLYIVELSIDEGVDFFVHHSSKLVYKWTKDITELKAGHV